MSSPLATVHCAVQHCHAKSTFVFVFADEPEDDRDDPDVHFDDFAAADFATREVNYDCAAHLDWTEASGSGHALPGEDGEGGFIREPSVDSEVQAEAVPIEDGAGGYIIDPSMVSNSPIRSFKRLSDLDPRERAGFDNQFNSKRGRRSQRGRGNQPMSSEERRSTTWGRADFDDLIESGKALCSTVYIIITRSELASLAHS